MTDVQRQATQLRDSVSSRERFMEAVLESVIDYAIIALDPQGLVVSWNEGAHRILGWTEAEMLGKPVSLFFTDQDRADGIPQAEIDTTLAAGRCIGERWHLRRDGTCFWASGEMMPLLDRDGCRLGYIKILRDRTEQQLALQEQREETEFLRGVLASSADCIKVLDLKGRVTFVSETGQRLLELTDFSQVKDCPWPDFWQGAARSTAVDAIAVARAGGIGQFRAEALTMAGTPRYWDVIVTPILGADGRPERLLSVSRDITEMMTAETMLAESEQRQRLAAEAANFGTWDLEVATGVFRWDRRCKALFGWDADHPVTYESFIERVHPEDRALTHAAIQDALSGAGLGRYHAEYRTLNGPDGAERWVAATGQVQFEDGIARRFIGATTDITPRKLAEAHARMLGEELQHRIKNTLAIVQAIVRQTLRGQPGIAQAQDTIDQRLAAMGRAHGMLTVGGWTNTDLRTLIDAALELHDTRSGRFRVGGPTVRLPAQAAMSLALLLHELFTNATKYGALSTPDGEVDIHWTLQPGQANGIRALELIWRETGGPAVVEPKQRGFGSRLIERSLGNALSGSAVIEFLNQGVVCTVKGLVESIPE